MRILHRKSTIQQSKIPKFSHTAQSRLSTYETLKGVVPEGSDKDYDFDLIWYLFETKQLRVSEIWF